MENYKGNRGPLLQLNADQKQIQVFVLVDVENDLSRKRYAIGDKTGQLLQF